MPEYVQDSQLKLWTFSELWSCTCVQKNYGSLNSHSWDIADLLFQILWVWLGPDYTQLTKPTKSRTIYGALESTYIQKNQNKPAKNKEYKGQKKEV